LVIKNPGFGSALVLSIFIYFRKMEGLLPLAEIRIALPEGEEAGAGLGPAGGLAPAYRMH
jgi:hypothetical protein